MNNYERALSGYSNSAGEINSNLGQWRGDVDNIKAQNKSGLQSAISDAKGQVDMDALTGIGEEFALKSAKKYATEKLGFLYKKTGLKTLDQKLGKGIQDKFNETFKGKGSAADVAESGEGVELGDMTGGSGTGGDLPMSEVGGSGGSGGVAGDAGDDAASFLTDGSMGADAPTVASDVFATGKQSFKDFLNKFQTGEDSGELPRTGNGDIDFDAMDAATPSAPPADANDAVDSILNEPKTEQVSQGQDVATRNTAAENESNALDSAEPTDLADATDVTDGISNAASNAADAAANVGADAANAVKSGIEAGKNIVSGAGDALTTGVDTAITGAKDLAETAGRSALGGLKSAAGDALDAAGVALESTGVLAPLGVLAQVAGGVLEGGAIVQMGEGIAHWWDTAVLGEKPKVDFKGAVAPKLPQTLASRGLMAAPTMDSNFDVPSTAGGW
tara:strand:- start:1638 stop:2978 length:1341 start_codon:yes stop_codon:yes gene_type:complete